MKKDIIILSVLTLLLGAVIATAVDVVLGKFGELTWVGDGTLKIATFTTTTTTTTTTTVPGTWTDPNPKGHWWPLQGTNVGTAAEGRVDLGTASNNLQLKGGDMYWRTIGTNVSSRVERAADYEGGGYGHHFWTTNTVCTTQGTIEIWMCNYATVTGNVMASWNNLASPERDWALYISGSDGGVSFKYYDTSSFIYNCHVGGVFLTSAGWQPYRFVAIAFDNTSCKIYTNGILALTSNLVGVTLSAWTGTFNNLGSAFSQAGYHSVGDCVLRSSVMSSNDIYTRYINTLYTNNIETGWEN